MAILRDDLFILFINGTCPNLAAKVARVLHNSIDYFWLPYQGPELLLCPKAIKKAKKKKKQLGKNAVSNK